MNSEHQKTVSFKTLGCRLNKAETAKISAGFIAAGYAIVPFSENADISIIHTCTITGTAEKECIRLARSIKKRNPDTFVVMAGCAAEVDKGQLQQKSGADLIAGQNIKFNLPDIINNKVAQHQHHTPRPVETNLSPIFNTTRAWLKVQDGCSFKCAYCIVPYTRGPTRALPFNAIIDEAYKLAENGYKEIIITGANVGCYNNDGKRLIDIIIALEKIEKIQRIRISSIEITTAEHQIIEYMAESNKLCNFLHLPLQTGDDRLLKNMGRRYNSDYYRKLIEFACETIPDVGLGTDIITGLPGEDEAAFNNTLQIINDYPFSNLHVFPYSIRKNTPAAEMSNQVPQNIAKERTKKLIQIGNEKKKKFAESFIGKKVTILTEKTNNDTAFGWTEEYIAAEIYLPGVKPNQIVTFIPTDYKNGKLK